MEKHISNKLLRGLFALSAGFLLASCDPVHALPTNHAESIVVNEDKSSIDVKDNDLLQIYNLIESGKNEEVVSQILREIAEKKFGTYKDFLDIEAGTKTVKEFVEEEGKQKARESYFGTDDETRTRRYTDFAADIKERISESFYNEITSGSYNDQDGKFSEEKLYNSKRYDLYDLPAASQAVKDNKFYVTKDLTKENAFDKLEGDYHSAEGKRGYIEEKVYPEILKNKLVESYIYDKNPASLGRAYARKIKYVKVSYEEEFASLWKMLKSFSTKYIQTEAGKMDFELITGAVKGFTKFDFDNEGDDFHYMINNLLDNPSEDDEKITGLLDDAHPGQPDNEKLITVPDTNDYWYGDYKGASGICLVPAGDYYVDTKLGEILKSYDIAIDAEDHGRFATSAEKTELEKFTGEGKSKEYGLMQKLISLAKEDYTTDGWFLKNGGATELPSSIRDRLFNIKVANILDDEDKLPEENPIGKYDDKNYVRNINGNKLVLSSEASPVEDEPFNYIHQDVDGKAFYIVSVEEAPSTAKFNKDNKSAYKKADGITPDTDRIERLSRQVAKVLGTKDSYIKDAYTDILKGYDFKFYDSSLFDYLNEEYPDLDLDENDD